MHMRMVGERRSPRMQHRRDADPGAQMLGIGGDGEHGLGRRLEQKAIDFRLVLPGDGADRRRQREHDVIIGQRQKLGLAVRQPLACSGSLTLWAMPVAAGVVADDGVTAVLASRDMTAKLRRAAGFDGAPSLSTARGSDARRWPCARRPRGCGRCPQPQARDAAWPKALKPWARPSSSRSGKAGPRGSSPCGSCLWPRACKAPSC